MSEKPLLTVENLSKTFVKNGQHIKVIDKISFNLKQGEVLGLIGESGSGKSTIAKLITKLLAADGGSIQFEGKEITKLNTKELQNIYKNIQMVFQTPISSFDPRRTLGDGITESLRNNNIDKAECEQRLQQLLSMCGLDSSFAQRYPSEVSGGQCQRAAIARALAINPKLIILDEATSSLDVTIQAQIIELLQQLKAKQKLSFIFICHNLALVQEFCDRVIILHHGQIVEEGTPNTVINQPQSKYTKVLIEAALL